MRKALVFMFVALFVLATFNTTYCQANSNIPFSMNNCIYTKLDSETIGVVPPTLKPNSGFIILHEYTLVKNFFVYIHDNVPNIDGQKEFMAVLSITPTGGETLNIPIIFTKNERKEFPSGHLSGFAPVLYNCYINSLYAGVVSKFPSTYLKGTLQMVGDQNVSAVVYLEDHFIKWGGILFLIVIFLAFVFVAIVVFIVFANLLIRFFKKIRNIQ